MLRRLLTFLTPYKTAVILAPLLMIVDVAGAVTQPYLMSKIVDVGIGTADLDYIIKIGLIMIGISLISIIVNVGNVYYSSSLGVGFSYEMRKELFKKIQGFSFSNIDKFSPGSLITRITNDVDILQRVIIMSFRLLIRAPLMLVFAIIMAISINREMALIIAVITPLLAISIYFILKTSVPYFKKMQKKLDWLNTVVQENVTNIRLVKSFVREDHEKEKFGVANDELKHISIRASHIVIMMIPVMQLIMGLSIVGIVWFGGNKIMEGSFLIGEFMSFISYIMQILISLMMLSMTIMTFSRASASYDRIVEVLDETPAIVDSPEAIKNDYRIERGKIEFKDVFFKYQPQAGKYVLRNINLNIEAGETIGIIGSTGSSKSTLVNLIPRLYDVSKGELLIDDRNIKEYTLENISLGVSMVLQNVELFSGTIKENIKWGNPDAGDREVIQAAMAAQAHDFIISFPKQYDTVLEQGAVNVSGGQKQRISIARALLKKAPILILDNSTSALDTVTESKIKQYFETEMKDTTLLIISQKISSIQQADKIIVMEDGVIEAMGTHDSLIETCSVYNEIFTSQQSKILIEE